MTDLNPTIFYDGDCALCHGTVLFVLARDRSATFRFAPLDGGTFEQLRGARGIDSMTLPDSIVLFEGPQQPLLFESDAAIRILIVLGGPWKLLGGACRLFPRFLRDFVYRFIARNRKRWFGSTDSACPIMPARYRSRFEIDTRDRTHHQTQ